STRSFFQPAPPAASFLRRDAGADLAGNAGAAEPAIAARIFREILLVVVIGEIELRCREDFRRDCAVAFRFQCGLILLLRFFGGLPLRVVEGVDAGAVLRADVVSLPHTLRGVVAFPKGF